MSSPGWVLVMNKELFIMMNIFSIYTLFTNYLSLLHVWWRVSWLRSSILTPCWQVRQLLQHDNWIRCQDPGPICHCWVPPSSSCGLSWVTSDDTTLPNTRTVRHKNSVTSANTNQDSWLALLHFRELQKILLLVDPKHIKNKHLLMTYPFSTKCSEQTVVPFHKRKL